MDTYKIGTPGPDDPVTVVMEIFKCKLDANGMIDKLKTRIVFRGDQYEPTMPEDMWSPFASYLAYHMFLTLCTKFGIFPSQTDLVQAYLQCLMKENVFIKFPLYWAEFLPDNMRQYCGVPLRLKRALYGYTYSGKRLYEDQEQFLIQQGLTQSPLLGLWYKHLPNNGILLVLLFADDFLCASTSSKAHFDFIEALKARFEVEHKPRAD
jgi:Reverse transcriptase (RNA-dependent DNA polymerase)